MDHLGSTALPIRGPRMRLEIREVKLAMNYISDMPRKFLRLLTLCEGRHRWKGERRTASAPSDLPLGKQTRPNALQPRYIPEDSPKQAPSSFMLDSN